MKRPVVTAGTSAGDLQDLRAFCQVVDLGSITAAAKVLGETKGSVSRRLTRLERALGVVVVQRSPRRVQATEDGVAYRARVGRALELLDDAAVQVQQALAAPHGHLRVTAPTDIGLSVIAPLLAGFIEKYPDITVEMVLTEARLDFDAHQIDVAIRASANLQDSALVAHRLQDVTGKLFAAPAYLARRGTPRSVDDLTRHTMLIGVYSNRGQATLNMRRQGETEATSVKVRATISGDFSLCKEAAVAGAGIALLPVSVAQLDVDAGRLAPVLKNYSVFTAALHLIQHGSRFMQPKVRAFRDYMLEAFGVRARR